jgi:hypothetical protein
MALLPSFSEIAKFLKKGETEKAEKRILKLREAALDLQEENLALREEIKKLRNEKSARASLEFSDGVYWRLEGDERVGPFCPRCYDEHHQLSELLDGSRYVGKTRWICTVCNRVFD